MTGSALGQVQEFQRTVLPNGLTVVSERMPHVRSVAVGAWVKSASVHEAADVMGVSHMLEHLVFKGTERRTAKDIALSLESLGGSLDAYTSREHTVYQARVLDEHLAPAVDVLADIIFRPALRESDLDLERKVVLEEIAMVEDAPDDLVFELHNEALWGRHPLGYSILGSRSTVGGLTVDNVRALHARAYRPSNIVVSAAGSVEHERLIELLVGAGWDRPEPSSSAAGRPLVPVSEHAVKLHVARDTAQSHVVLGATAPAYGDDRRYAFALLVSVLGGGMSSRLFQRVREERGLAYSIYAFHHHYRQVGMHGVYFATSPEQVDESLAAVHAEMSDVVEKGLPPDELELGKSQLKGQLTLSLESPGARLYRAAATELYGEPFRGLDDVLALVDAVKSEDVAAIAREFFPTTRMTTMILGPGATTE